MIPLDLRAFFDLTSHGPDTFVGTGPRYPWGGLYGGHIVAQALRAAAYTVESDVEPHSLRAYFIRRGDHAEPVRYEVDRIRNGKSFATRRVVARQATGAILNLEASFHRHEDGPDSQSLAMPGGIPRPESLESSSWSNGFDRRWVGATETPAPAVGSGRVLAWMRVAADLSDNQLLQRCALAYLSDDLPTDTVVRIHPGRPDQTDSSTNATDQGFFAASLDHTMWFHRPVRADRWHLHDFACHSYQGGRGLSVGHIYAEDGTHVATVAQEVLVRRGR